MSQPKRRFVIQINCEEWEEHQTDSRDHVGDIHMSTIPREGEELYLDLADEQAQLTEDYNVNGLYRVEKVQHWGWPAEGDDLLPTPVYLWATPLPWPRESA